MKKQLPDFYKMMLLRTSLLFLILYSSPPVLSGQKSTKIAIHTTGCTVEVFCFPGRFDVYELDNKSTVYANDCEKEGVKYGIYCIKLKNKISDLRAAQDTVLTYLDFLKLDFGIVKTKGYDKGHQLNKGDNTRGVLIPGKIWIKTNGK